MERSEKFKNVEKVLAIFPKEVQVNYYKNKETLVIERDMLLLNKAGVYLPYENIIKLANLNCLEHELFHMAFNDRENLGKEVIPNIYLNNGVSYIDGKTGREYGIGLTEGLTESLARKANTCGLSRKFECRIVDCLISIYGEELYCFPLKNDPIGFYSYGFNDIERLRNYLDLYIDVFSNVNDIINKCNSAETEEIETLVLCCKKFIPEAITGAISSIINEYNSCLNKKITRLELKEKIIGMFDSNDILSSIQLCQRVGVDLKQEIFDIIDNQLMNKLYIR